MIIPNLINTKYCITHAPQQCIYKNNDNDELFNKPREIVINYFMPYWWVGECGHGSVWNDAWITLQSLIARGDL